MSDQHQQKNPDSQDIERRNNSDMSAKKLNQRPTLYDTSLMVEDSSESTHHYMFEWPVSHPQLVSP